MISNKKTVVFRYFFIVASLFFSSFVLASNFSYTNFDVGITSEPSGFYTAGRYSFHEQAHVVTTVSIPNDADWELTGGVGFNAPIASIGDFFGSMQLAYFRGEKTLNSDYGQVGVKATFGTRVLVAPQIEVHFELGRTTYTSENKTTTFKIGTRFHSTEDFSMDLSLQPKGTYDKQYIFTVRYVL